MGGQYDNAGLRRARRVAGRYISLRRANAQLADWIAASERRLSTIYITHGHPDHFFGLKLLRDPFPEARALATPRWWMPCKPHFDRSRLCQSTKAKRFVVYREALSKGDDFG